MKILQVAPYFYPYVGGQERYVKNLAMALAARGHEVKVFTSNYPKSKKYEVIQGVEIRRFEILCRPFNNPISPTLFFNIIKYCKDFDIIHCHNEHALVSQYCLLAKLNYGIPLIITCHGQLRFNHPLKDLIERMYSKTFGAVLLRWADRVITISQSDKKYIQSLGVPLENIRIIPNGVNPNFYCSKQLDLPEDLVFKGKIILFVGPVIKRKGPHILIQAIPHIVKKYPNVAFIFAGDGDFRYEAERLSNLLHVEKWTHFLGYLTQEQLYALYKHCDILVLPSFSEALSYTILDAFAFSKPVVSTQIPCIEDYLSDIALLVPPGDYKALAEAILHLLNNPELAKELGEKGKKMVETNFRWDIVTSKIEEVYTEVLKK